MNSVQQLSQDFCSEIYILLGNFAVLLGYFIFQILRDFWNIVREEIDDFYNLSQFLNLE